MATIDVKDAAGATQTIQQPNANGQATMANSRPVVLASDQTPVVVGNGSFVVSANFNRPADTTAYAVGDLMANSTTAGSVTPMAFALARTTGNTGMITRARMSTSKTGLAGTETFRLHLFRASPTPANGDNGAFSVNGIASQYLGKFDLVLDSVFSDGAKGFALPVVGSQIIFDTSGSANIYGLLESRTAYTPANGETFTIALEGIRD